MLESLRTGAWLTRERVRVYSVILLVGYVLSVVALLISSNGRTDRFDRPLGTDFSEVYAAGVFVLQGQPAKPYDNAAHEQMQKKIFGDRVPFYAWGYPPYFLAIAAALALAPYLLALAIWQASTLCLYLSAMRKLCIDHDWLLPALAFPAAYVNLIHGQNAFFTAGLFAWALIVMDRRPWLAGALIGLLVYKPQFGVLIPIALLAGRQWRAIAAACLVAGALTLATWLWFGVEVWRGFWAMSVFTRTVLTEQGNTGFYKIQTVFSGVRLLGGSVSLAYAFQLAAAAICIAIIVALWGRRADWRLRAAALMTGALLATPYALDYDMVVLGPPIGFMASYMAEKGARDWQKTILALAWACPLFARAVAMTTHAPVGVIIMAALMGVIWRADRANALQASGGRDAMATAVSPSP